jgi:L-rhamnose isomerase
MEDPMPKNTYQLNKDVSTQDAFQRTIEADHYKIADGYFHFYLGFGTTAEKVFSIDASRVHLLEVVSK